MMQQLPSHYAMALIGLTTSLALVAPFAASSSDLAEPKDGLLPSPHVLNVMLPADSATDRYEGLVYPGS